MSGKHRSRPPAPESHWRVRRAGRGWLLSGALVTAVALVAGSVAVAVRGSAGASCPDGTRRLAVTATAEIAPVITDVAQSLRRRGGPATCLRVSVVAGESAAVAEKLPATSSSPDVLPDVWIPDSSLWVTRARAAGAEVPLGATSLARSPVVLAVPAAIAQQLGWPAERPGLAELVGTEQGRPVRLGFAGPRRSAATVGLFLGLQAAVGVQPDAGARLTAALRAGLRDLPADQARLLDTASGRSPVAVPVTEQAVHALSVARQPASASDGRSAKASTTVVAVYAPPPAMVLDYPYVVLTRDRRAAGDAGRLLAALQDGLGRQRILDEGFRDARGAGGSVLAEDPALDATSPATADVPSAQAVDRAVRSLELLDLPSRMLAVIDISGSMGEQVPGGGSRSRLDLTKEAASNGLSLFPDDTEIGLWAFSTNLTRRTDHRELVAIGPLGMRADGVSGRERLADALSGLEPVRGGSTGLYDTALAAVRTVRRGWNAQRVNSVVLLTDGRNSDQQGIKLDALLDTLRRENDPDRPVPLYTIAYGPDSDVRTLRAISGTTGGTTYVVKDPRQVRAVFLDAIGRRPASLAS